MIARKAAVIAVLSTTILIPSMVGGAFYQRITTPTHIYEYVEGEKPKVATQPLMITRLFRYISATSYAPHPLKTAEAIVHNSDRPLDIAAMAKVETGFDSTKVGADGELGMLQLMEYWRPEGYNRFDLAQNVQLADNVLDIKTREAKGNPTMGIQRYNGAGPKAREYRKKVLEVKREIKKTPGRV